MNNRTRTILSVFCCIALLFALPAGSFADGNADAIPTEQSAGTEYPEEQADEAKDAEQPAVPEQPGTELPAAEQPAQEQIIEEQSEEKVPAADETPEAPQYPQLVTGKALRQTVGAEETWTVEFRPSAFGEILFTISPSEKCNLTATFAGADAAAEKGENGDYTFTRNVSAGVVYQITIRPDKAVTLILKAEKAPVPEQTVEELPTEPEQSEMNSEAEAAAQPVTEAVTETAESTETKEETAAAEINDTNDIKEETESTESTETFDIKEAAETAEGTGDQEAAETAEGTGDQEAAETAEGTGIQEAAETAEGTVNQQETETTEIVAEKETKEEITEESIVTEVVDGFVKEEATDEGHAVEEETVGETAAAETVEETVEEMDEGESIEENAEEDIAEEPKGEEENAEGTRVEEKEDEDENTVENEEEKAEIVNDNSEETVTKANDTGKGQSKNDNAAENKILTDEEMLELGYMKIQIVKAEGADVFAEIDHASDREMAAVDHYESSEVLWVKETNSTEYAEIFNEEETAGTQYVLWDDVLILLKAEQSEEEEEEQPLPARQVLIRSTLAEKSIIGFGEEIEMTAELINFKEEDRYSCQWMFSTDGNVFEAIDGANGLSYSYHNDFYNINYIWKIVITIEDN